MARDTINKNDRRTKYTRKVIKDSYLELLGELPSAKITVTEVCRRADINRGTFYIHYEDLKQVMEELENIAYDEFVKFIHSSLRDEDNRQQLANEFFLRGIKNWSTQLNIFTEFYTERLYEKVTAYAESLLVGLCVETGKLSRDEAELFASFMVHACFKAVKKLSEGSENEIVARNAFVNKMVNALFAAVIDPYEINAVFSKRK
ncbi:MAG: TetR/AcrR family transcriptional regulator [Lachnospiraceae bacterium]|nr:TetR/AcrR family transcriptional regulator [Lachnospiraceae bacterium]